MVELVTSIVGWWSCILVDGVGLLSSDSLPANDSADTNDDTNICR